MTFAELFCYEVVIYGTFFFRVEFYLTDEKFMKSQATENVTILAEG